MRLLNYVLTVVSSFFLGVAVTRITRPKLSDADIVVKGKEIQCRLFPQSCVDKFCLCEEK